MAGKKRGPGCRLLVLFLQTATLTACVHVTSVDQRRSAAAGLAERKGWHPHALVAGAFSLMSFTPSVIVPAARLTIYIEGDGLAWISGDLPSRDPTPNLALGLQLALRQPDGNAAYLARPCQFIGADASPCSPRYWTQMRFAPEVIAATNLAADQLKALFGAKELILVGYSGGAAIALLTALRRHDVIAVITVAGNLDHHAWSDYHRVAPLKGSLSPADFISALEGVPQIHLVGARDRVVPPWLTQAFMRRFHENASIRLLTISHADHRCCWRNDWADLWRQLHPPMSGQMDANRENMRAPGTDTIEP